MKKIIFLTIVTLALFLALFFVNAESCDIENLRPVKMGQRGNDVSNLQACLIEAGYDIPSGATGYYGSQTKKAVKMFYANWYGTWDGNNIGPLGVKKLKEIIENKRSKMSVENIDLCPSKTTAEYNEITFVGRILDLGQDDKVYVWFEYGTSTNNMKQTEKISRRETGIYCQKITNLNPCTTYYYKAGIQNKHGTVYGEIKTIQTKCIESSILKVR